ncbi:lantibiotic dehydratase [Streptomyces albofaciens JCM 4342]|uniref:lantibiotic dehydratase n=1 Tax=Streptomyces albofaciens TaxID=66866 RepID=UPI00123ACF93|nr:lantibiotic dehydratase [Streptomyces albofaciens]KAA6214321.1 lantibiotic dehydratase [Streptomyces albofaciens JCM 4342]
MDDANTRGPDGPAPTVPTALLRTAGLPAEFWTRAGNPQLFDRVGEYDRARRQQADRARALAEQLGTTVVPHPGLADTDRGAVLSLRRRLHGGAAPGEADCAYLKSLATVPESLVHEAVAVHRIDVRLSRTRRELERAVADEAERVGALGWSLACASPVMRAFLDEAAPDLVPTVERRLAHGEPWSGKRLRKSAAYLWRALGRAAVKTTPRGWVGQVAPVPLEALPRSGRTAATEEPPLLAPGTALGPMASETAENVHVARTRLTAVDLTTADPATPLAPAPLHFRADGAVRCWVIDPAVRDRLRRVELRRTRPLDAVLTLLAEGPRPLGEIEAALLGTTGTTGGGPGMGPGAGPGTGSASAPGSAPGSGPGTPYDDTRRVLRGFLAHLHGLGVLQVCAAPRRRRSAWTPAVAVRERDRLPCTEPLGDADFVDSYRMAEGAGSGAASVPVAAADAVRDALRTAARLAALREADRHPEAQHAAPARRLPDELRDLDERPRPLSDLLAGHWTGTGPLPEDGRPTAPELHRYEGWHPARTAHSGYARLLAHLATRGDARPVDLTDALLDTFGAPPGSAVLPPWPVDCLLRPLAGPGPSAVLETVSPAGMLDARFADALDALHAGHGGYGNAERHRAFLAAVEREADVRFVEVLVLPLAERAANAVRRPLVTSWWTGDPDPAPYYGTAPDPGTARYLPLDRITLRRDGPRVIAEADGRRILPVHHGTRSALPPYDVLLRLLMAAGHPATAYLVQLDGLAGAFPRAERLPRLTVGGRLVVSPAVWRLPRTALWRAGDTDLAKARTLAALRRSAGLPRYAFLRYGAGAKPVPADLAALPTLRVVDRLLARGSAPEGGGELLVEEMLPAPDGLVLRDRAHRGGDRGREGAYVAAQLLMRFPHDRAIGDLAASAAAALCGGTHLPGTLAPNGRAAGADPIH